MEKEQTLYSLSLTKKEREDFERALSMTSHRTLSALLRALVYDFLEEKDNVSK